MVNYSPGDRVSVRTKDKEYKGTVMPSENTSSLMIKLDNGYNVGIDKKKIKEVKVLERFKAEKEKATERMKKDPKKPTIAILHTGGTIASKVDYRTGGVVAQFEPEELVKMFPEMLKYANIESDLVANRMSEDFNFQDYKIIINSVKKHSGKVDGVIIGHGTDTLGYTGAALAFALEGIGIPVLIVGSQRSSDRGSSDAALNLINAAYFIAKSDFSGVGICMHESIGDENCLVLPACKTRKMHTSRRDAFQAVNDKPIARVNYKKDRIEFIKKDYSRKGAGKLKIYDGFEEKVGLIKTHTNMDPKQFLFYKGYKGLVVEGTGLGHMPMGKDDVFIKAVRQLVDSGTIVSMTSQCVFGRVHPKVYTNLRKISEIGVLYSEDMLPETAFIKLAWLLGNFSKKEAVELYTKNLRGEINPRILKDEFLD